jgi:hypothetical protein
LSIGLPDVVKCRRRGTEASGVGHETLALIVGADAFDEKRGALRKEALSRSRISGQTALPAVT